MEQQDDEALVAQAQIDTRAFAQLYARYAATVFGYCARRLGDREAAADATSQVFLKALAGLPKYSPGSFRAWLFTIASHVVADSGRRQIRAVPIEKAVDAVNEIADLEMSPEEYLLRGEDDLNVSELLDRLTTPQRRIVELRLAGLTGPEISTVLGMSISGVRSTQFRAYARLRVLMRGRIAAEGAGA